MWLPSRGATSVGIFSPLMLAIKSVPHVYLEGHLGAYVNSNLVADPETREAISCAEEREGAWTRKSCTIIQCRDIFKEIQEEDEGLKPSQRTQTPLPRLSEWKSRKS